MSLRGRRHDGGGQNELIFFYTGNASATFDPTITTGQSTTITWQPDDAAPTTTTGASHAFSYVPGAGSHRCKVTVVAGLLSITAVDARDDKLTYIKNASRLINCLTWNIENNPSLTGEFPPSTATSITAYSDASLLVSLARYPAAITLQFGNVPIQDSVANLSRLCTSFNGYSSGSPAPISGSFADLPASLQTCVIYGQRVTAASIAHMVNAKTLSFAGMALSQSDVDLVIDSIYQAVVADANHFVASTPITMNIGGTGVNNASPSGTYQYAASPSTGLEKVYYLCHLAAHAWAITWNGGSGP